MQVRIMLVKARDIWYRMIYPKCGNCGGRGTQVHSYSCSCCQGSGYGMTMSGMCHSCQGTGGSSRTVCAECGVGRLEDFTIFGRIFMTVWIILWVGLFWLTIVAIIFGLL